MLYLIPYSMLAGYLIQAASSKSALRYLGVLMVEIKIVLEGTR